MANPKTVPKKPKKERPPAAKRRRIKIPEYHSFHLEKRIKNRPPASLPGAFRLLGRALKVLKQHWKLFLGIAAVYGLLSLLLVQGMNGQSGITDIKKSLDQAFGGQFGKLGTSVTLFSYLVGSAGATAAGGTGGAYQIVLLVVVSL